MKQAATLRNQKGRQSVPGEVGLSLLRLKATVSSEKEKVLDKEATVSLQEEG